MRFWDSSAIVPLLGLERSSDAVAACAREDREVTVWWGTRIECASAIARLEREGAPAAAITDAFMRLDELAERWTEIEPQNEIREVARRLLRVHPLRAADALQLAAAYTLAERLPPSLEIVTLDSRLASAAMKEGFRVLEPK